MQKLSEIAQLFAAAGKKLKKNQPIILASSTAFFTIFSIPPMIIITVNALSLYFKSENITGSFTNKIEEIFGASTADQMSAIAQNFSDLASKPWITIAGSVFLVFVATNLFNIIKISINQIWNIRFSSSGNFLLHLKKRAIALGIILFTGLLFILSTFSDSLIAIIEGVLPKDYVAVDTIIILIISKAIAIIFITLWFTTIFRFLPDAKVSWKPILTGAVVTSALFMLGKFILDKLLINSNIDNIFETSTSVVLIMLFIFYASIIMYYGASFVFVYSEYISKQIKLRKNARRVEVKTVDEKG